MIKKQLYAAPATEVLELHLEGNVLETISNPSATPSETFDGFDSY